jgi:hypothetical protein
MAFFVGFVMKKIVIEVLMCMAAGAVFSIIIIVGVL